MSVASTLAFSGFELWGAVYNWGGFVPGFGTGDRFKVDVENHETSLVVPPALQEDGYLVLDLQGRHRVESNVLRHVQHHHAQLGRSRTVPDVLLYAPPACVGAKERLPWHDIPEAHGKLQATTTGAGQVILALQRFKVFVRSLSCCVHAAALSSDTQDDNKYVDNGPLSVTVCARSNGSWQELPSKRDGLRVRVNMDGKRRFDVFKIDVSRQQQPGRVHSQASCECRHLMHVCCQRATWSSMTLSWRATCSRVSCLPYHALWPAYKLWSAALPRNGAMITRTN